MAEGAEATQLETPLLLLAMPQVHDRYFQKSVVLLVHHQEEGSLGFVVNRPTRFRVADVLGGLNLTWRGDPELLAYLGGPVQPELGTVIYDCEGRPDELAGGIVCPGVAMTQHLRELEALATAPPAALRLFLGYAGWGEGQLVQEIQRHDWLTAPVRNDLIFGPDPEAIWTQALASVGIDPASLPLWTPDGGDASTTN
ncbi:MAG: YqgE/AlgH family protein [Acidobacteria bacterium]|nr:MAG: YqgE/AlgH family protein [Acidobacteriota bacterium]